MIFFPLFQAAVLCSVMKIQCLNSSPQCNITYSGEKDNIHMWSKNTAAGDEIGYDFMSRVLNSKISFSGFCSEFTRIYQSHFPMSSNFMSKSTFVNWFFSWAASMKIDFRLSIGPNGESESCDPWCGNQPKYLACDATHIGIKYRNMNIKTLDAADSEVTVHVNHRRYDRVFLPYVPGVRNELVSSVREYLRELVHHMLYESPAPVNDVEEMLENLTVTCHQLSTLDILRNFISKSYPADIMYRLANFLILLLTDAPVSSVLNPRYFGDLKQRRIALLQEQDSLDVFDNVCPEFGSLLGAARTVDKTEEFLNFMFDLIQFVEQVHATDAPTQDAVPVPGSYNPETGVAYYFTRHGEKLRSMPRYDRDLKSSSTYDAIPTGPCSKNYTKVSHRGWSHLFLYFCPLHGICYGYHIIDGAEGRKDAHSSVFQYMENAPAEIFYDFSCSLNEYTLNREPRFWRNTRFWHDLFHGYSHKCGPNYSSSRISSLNGLDTSICEQFNSFLQCIKYTATHLSQSHFCFFLQFMIHKWNCRKINLYTNKLEIALQGADRENNA